MTDGSIPYASSYVQYFRIKSWGGEGEELVVLVFSNCNFHRCHFLMVENNQLWCASRWNSWPSGTVLSTTILATDIQSTVLQLTSFLTSRFQMLAVAWRVVSIFLGSGKTDMVNARKCSIARVTAASDSALQAELCSWGESLDLTLVLTPRPICQAS